MTENNACPIDFTIDLIGNKWSMWILWSLQDGPLRFGQLQKMIPRITEKMLTQQLKKFESNHLVIRTVYPQVPPKVEYTLTQDGKSLKAIMTSIKQWGRRTFTETANLKKSYQSQSHDLHQNKNEMVS